MKALHFYPIDFPRYMPIQFHGTRNEAFWQVWKPWKGRHGQREILAGGDMSGLSGKLVYFLCIVFGRSGTFERMNGERK